jgi:hypothetical protein
VHDGVGRLDHVEGVESDAAFPAEGVEVLGTLRERLRESKLANKVNSNVRMSGSIGRNVLIEVGCANGEYR